GGRCSRENFAAGGRFSREKFVPGARFSPKNFGAGGRLPCTGFAAGGVSRGGEGSKRRCCSLFFLDPARGSGCVPPGRQSRPRASAAGAGRFRASSGESQRRPCANQSMMTFLFVRRSRLKVGSSSSRSRERNAVGALSMRMVQ